MAYSDVTQKARLYYWQRESPGSTAEVDYVIQNDDELIPIEVKSGLTGGLKSLIRYIHQIEGSGRGAHFSSRDYQRRPLYSSIPLYNVSKLFRPASENTEFQHLEIGNGDPMVAESINRIIRLINSTAELLQFSDRLSFQIHDGDPLASDPFLKMIQFVDSLFDFIGKRGPEWNMGQLKRGDSPLAGDMNQIVKNVMRLRKF